MLRETEQLRVLFQELKSILEKENDYETVYIRNQLDLGLHLLMNF
ncbi:hypothetical protein QUF56_07935 [Ureibacillus composti]|nr:hypothetical protein [Ureibacillus composti]